MNKTVFLMVSAMVIFLSGCAGSGYALFQTTGTANALVNPPFPAPLQNTADRGIHLSISNRSSLNIDVECILDYVQGEPMVETQYLQDNFMNPWIRWNIAF
jgi:hypothetical protein